MSAVGYAVGHSPFSQGHPGRSTGCMISAPMSGSVDVNLSTTMQLINEDLSRARMLQPQTRQQSEAYRSALRIAIQARLRQDRDLRA